MLAFYFDFCSDEGYISAFYFDFCTEGGICWHSTSTSVQTRDIYLRSTLTSVQRGVYVCVLL